MNMTNPNPLAGPFEFAPVMPASDRRMNRTQGYTPRPPRIEDIIGLASVIQEEAPPAPQVEEDVLEKYLATQFDRILKTVHHHLNSTEEKQSLASALAEVEFYKQVIADAKVAWTKAVPHEEFAWDDLINLGTILSRTPNKG